MHAPSSPEPDARTAPAATDGGEHAPSADASTAAETKPQPRRRRRRRLLPRRWSLRLPVLLILLLLLLAVVTQFVLWTNVPRDLVLGQLEIQLGLRFSAASLSTGWLGDTRLRDVAIALPLSDEALVRVPEMRVQHTSLVGLLLTQAVTLKLVELHDAHVLVRQDAGGRWNVQEVAELIARAAGKQTAEEQAKKSSRPELPSLRITNATVEIVDRSGRRTVIQPVTVAGDPQDALTWRYDAGIGVSRKAMPAEAPGIGVTGRLVTGGNWAHEVKMWGRHVEVWARPWTPSPLPSIAFSGQWNGALSAGAGITGRLVLDGIDVSGVRAGGAFAVNSEGTGVVFRPETLVVETSNAVVPELRMSAGRVVVDAKSAVVDNVTFLGEQGAARVNGRYDWAAATVDVSAYWSDLQVPGKGRLTQSGALTASVRTPLPGQLALKAELTSAGKLPAGDVWDADLALSGSGRGWTNVDWEFQARRLTVNAPKPLTFDGIAATVQTRGSNVSITSVRGPGQVMARGTGSYDAATKDWNIRLDLDNLPHPAGLTSTPNALTLNARGSQEYVILENPGLSIRGGDAELRVSGSYVYNVPKPVDVSVFLNHVPPRDPTTDQPPFRGYLHGETRVTGTAVPTDLAITGTLTGRDVTIFDRYVGELKADITGQADGERVTMRTTEFDALGAKWQVDAVFPEQAALGLNVNVHNLPLANVGTLAKSPKLEGTADARLAVLVPRIQWDAVKVSGVVNARNIRCGPTASADSLEASIVLADGTLRVDPVRLRKGEGQADLSAEMDVREFRKLSASLTFAAWPFEPSPGTKAELWGGTRGLRITLPGAVFEEGIRRGIYRPEFKASRLWITGPIDLSAALTLKDQPAGDLHFVADLNGRSVDLRSIAFDGLDGTVQGQALFNFDKPFETRGSLFFEDFNADRLASFFPDRPALAGLGGRFSGSVHVAPAPPPWPLEPLRITANVQNDGGRYRSIPIGPIRLSAFTNFDRLVIDDSPPQNPTTIEFADGLVRLWGRITLLEPGQELSPAATMPLLLSQLQVTLKQLDVDQMVHAFKPDAEKMPGKLSGSINALAGTRPGRRPGAPRSGQSVFEKSVRRITADGRIELTDSDLANLDALAFLYSAMSASNPGGPPSGKGDLIVHLEDGLLTLNNVHYFNRGTEARAIVQIDQIWHMPDSPIRGTVAGTARPFRDIKLPFLSNYNLDTIMTALQTDLTTVAVNGTVKNPKVGTVAFSDLGEGMRNLLLGDFEKERRPPSPTR
jgi:hypothetical protein